MKTRQYNVHVHIMKIGMVYTSKKRQSYQDENVSPRPPLIVNERAGNSHTTEQAATGPKSSLYTDLRKELPLYTLVT